MKIKSILIALLLVSGVQAEVLSRDSKQDKIILALRMKLKNLKNQLNALGAQSQIPGPKGDKGDRGLQGVPGLPGDKGDRGDSGFSQAPSGTVIKGYISNLSGIAPQGAGEGPVLANASFSFESNLTFPQVAGDIFLVPTQRFIEDCEISYPGSATLCMSAAHYAKFESGETAQKCGVADANGHYPDPAPGAICIYPFAARNVNRIDVRRYSVHDSRLVGGTVYWYYNEPGKTITESQGTRFHATFAVKVP